MSIVGAIGAYRSGKSFLLNSLRGVSCADGGVFGAGLCDAALDSLAAAGLFTVLHGAPVAATDAAASAKVSVSDGPAALAAASKI